MIHGNNSHGFSNEEQIILAINNKLFKDLNDNLKKFIHFIYPDIKSTTLLKAIKISRTHKPDIVIIINDFRFYISIKIGSSNSVHQEHINSFCTSLNLDSYTSNCFKFFIWGDNTLDGTGNIDSRMSVAKIKQNFPNIITEINETFKTKKFEILSRILFSGASNDRVDYIYYGDSIQGLWASKNEIIDYLSSFSEERDFNLKIGFLTCQAWNRSLNGNNDSKRGEIQFKWSSLYHDLLKISTRRGRD